MQVIDLFSLCFTCLSLGLGGGGGASGFGGRGLYGLFSLHKGCRSSIIVTDCAGGGLCNITKFRLQWTPAGSAAHLALRMLVSLSRKLKYCSIISIL